MDTVISPEMVTEIREQISRQLKHEVARIVEEAVADALHPQESARRDRRFEEQRMREDGALKAHAMTLAAPAVKAALMAEAAKYGPIQLRFTSAAAPVELQWVPCFPSHLLRR